MTVRLAFLSPAAAMLKQLAILALTVYFWGLRATSQRTEAVCRSTYSWVREESKFHYAPLVDICVWVADAELPWPEPLPRGGLSAGFMLRRRWYVQSLWFIEFSPNLNESPDQIGTFQRFPTPHKRMLALIWIKQMCAFAVQLSSTC